MACARASLSLESWRSAGQSSGTALVEAISISRCANKYHFIVKITILSGISILFPINCWKQVPFMVNPELKFDHHRKNNGTCEYHNIYHGYYLPIKLMVNIAPSRHVGTSSWIRHQLLGQPLPSVVGALSPVGHFSPTDRCFTMTSWTLQLWGWLSHRRMGGRIDIIGNNYYQHLLSFACHSATVYQPIVPYSE